MRRGRFGLALVAFAALAAAAGTVRAQTFAPIVALPAPSASFMPACAAGVAASSGRPRTVAGVAVQTVALALPTGTPCTVSGFPGIVFSGHAADAALRTGRLSTASSATLDAQTRATFTVRYVVASGRRSVGCGLAVVIGGTVATGPPVPLSPCEALSEIDVSSFSPLGASGLAAFPTPLANGASGKPVPPCNVADLGVRDAGSSSDGSIQHEFIAVQNRSLATCALPRAMHVQLLAQAGRLMPLTAPPSAADGKRASGDITLAAGHEASLRLDFTTRDTAGNPCPQSRAVALVFPDGRFTASAPALLAPCPGPDGIALRRTPLRAGVPLPGFE